MNNETPGIIEPGRLYLAAEARRRLQLGDWAWRKMRRAGLPVIRQGSRAYVLGDDLIDFFAGAGRERPMFERAVANNLQRQEIVRALELLMEPGQVTEVRALDATTSDRRYPGILSGYFNRWDLLAEAVLSQIIAAKGMYIVPNVVNPALIARAENRVRHVQKNDPTTADHDIHQRRWLLLDFDPIRPAGISATDFEHHQALELAHAVAHALALEAWPWPVISDSGNGAHLMYRIDLPADDGGLIERCLNALAVRFDSSAVKIDQAVFNPARIWKLPGTWAAKGDSTTERPHRLAKVLWAPAPPIAVTPQLLATLAAGAQLIQRERAPQSRLIHHQAQFDLADWIARHKLNVTGPNPWKGGRIWVFPVCPWNDQHTNSSAFIIQLENGALSAGCHHESCRAKSWRDLRDLVEPGWRDGRQVDLASVLPSQLPQAIRREHIRSIQHSRRRRS